MAPRLAGINAEQSLREPEASERRHVRDVAEERTRTEAARADADEICHRLKNMLAVVQAIADATLKPDVPMEDARAAFNSRLEALARAHAMLADANEKAPPIKRRYVTNDTTVEALGVILQQNPNGVLTYRYEMLSLLDSLDVEEHATQRGFYLTGRNGDSAYIFDRTTDSALRHFVTHFFARLP
jgi:hypothetical protein